jgi:hypothetical protein
MLIAAFIFVCARWQERPGIWLAAAMVALGYALSGIRWYFGAIAWAACGLFFLIAALRAPRRGWTLLAGAAIFAIMSQAVRIGGGSDAVEPVRRLLDPRETVTSLRRPSQVTHAITKARKGFDRSPGATTIAPGPLLAPAAAAASGSSRSSTRSRSTPRSCSRSSTSRGRADGSRRCSGWCCSS